MNRRGISMVLAATMAGGLTAGWGVVRLAGSDTTGATELSFALNTSDEKLDAAIHDLYAVISGPAGQDRDWDTMRSMFTEDAVMGICAKRQDGTVFYRGFTPEVYIEQNGEALEREGFFENEIGRESQRFGQMVHVWTTYEARRTEEGEVFMRGINSVQLVDMGNDGYKIRSIFWNPETPDNPLSGADHADDH